MIKDMEKEKNIMMEDYYFKENILMGTEYKEKDLMVLEK